MTHDEIVAAAMESLHQVAPESASLTVAPGKNFRDQFDFDSMDFVAFVLALDERLGTKTPEIDYPKLSSLEGCLAYFGK